MTIACGDSHTSTHGAFGAVAFGIGTSQVRDVLASQCLAMDPLKVRRITVNGRLGRGVYAKDVILEIIRRLGVNGGAGFAYEYAGDAIARMSMDERMTICNMSIEGAARVGYMNPDQTTIDYLRGRAFAPQGDDFERATKWWASLASDPNAAYDDEVEIDAASIRPTVTWGINPGQSVASTSAAAPANGRSAKRSRSWASARAARSRARGSTSRSSGRAPTRGCRISRGRADRPRPHVRAARARRWSCRDRRRCAPRRSAKACDRVFIDAGFEWRGAGCSMCLAMNPIARGPRDLRLLVEPEFQGTAGQPDRPHAADEPGDGRRGRRRRRGRGRPGVRPRGGDPCPLSAYVRSAAPAAGPGRRHRPPIASSLARS
jgi:3-isopropylmalate/(R)-2-methylmalate dehydratase large subunit